MGDIRDDTSIFFYKDSTGETGEILIFIWYTVQYMKLKQEKWEEKKIKMLPLISMNTATQNEGKWIQVDPDPIYFLRRLYCGELKRTQPFQENLNSV